MTLLDWLILAITLLFAVYGYYQGFIVGALSLVGFAIGAFLGTRIGPALLPDGSHSPYAPVFGLAGALIAGAILATGLEGIGLHLRSRLRVRSLGLLDGLLGAVLIGCLALGLAWIGGAIALQTPGVSGLREAVQKSVILQRLNAALPPSGPILNALARFDPFPRITGPEANVPAPNSAQARDPEIRDAGRSVVKVLGTACGLGIQGSGWVTDGDLVVTNAHVVAGEQDTTVLDRDGGSHGAQVVHFDPRNDIAVLRVDGMDEPSLRMASSDSVGTSGAVLGFPGNGPFTITPARLGQTETVLTRDAYGRGPMEREVVALRGNVRSGNSGGPMVDGDGRVTTTVFAATTGSGPPGGYGVPNSVTRQALERSDGPVGTGACAS